MSGSRRLAIIVLAVFAIAIPAMSMILFLPGESPPVGGPTVAAIGGLSEDNSTIDLSVNWMTTFDIDYQNIAIVITGPNLNGRTFVLSEASWSENVTTWQNAYPQYELTFTRNSASSLSNGDDLRIYRAGSLESGNWTISLRYLTYGSTMWQRTFTVG